MMLPGTCTISSEWEFRVFWVLLPTCSSLAPKAATDAESTGKTLSGKHWPQIDVYARQGFGN
jgi:hypothetical protein